jgi:hypothetical protein
MSCRSAGSAGYDVEAVGGRLDVAERGTQIPLDVHQPGGGDDVDHLGRVVQHEFQVDGGAEELVDVAHALICVQGESQPSAGDQHPGEPGDHGRMLGGGHVHERVPRGDGRPSRPGARAPVDSSAHHFELQIREEVLDYSKANGLLHRRVRELSGQATAAQVLERLRAPSVRHHFGQSTRPERPAVSLREHQAIIDAICARDPEAAERTTRLHLASVLEGLKAILATRSRAGAAGHPTPSDRARELVRGAYDVHIHVPPDATRGRVDDLTLAPRFAEVGLAGFVLTSDHLPTVGRAAMVRSAVPGFGAVGAITLNASVGGMNPVAVELAGRSGTQVVVLPTVDSASWRERTARAPEGLRPPMRAQLYEELQAEGVTVEPVEVVGRDGQVLEATRQVLRVIAKHDMTLVTGHLSAAETEAVVNAAAGAGVRRMVVTDSEFALPRVAVDWQRRLAAKGALLERCLTAPYTGKISWAAWLANIRAVGVEHSVLTSGLGQHSHPPVEDGLALLADRLVAEGFTEDEVRLVAVHNSRWLAGADVRRN